MPSARILVVRSSLLAEVAAAGQHRPRRPAAHPSRGQVLSSEEDCEWLDMQWPSGVVRAATPPVRRTGLRQPPRHRLRQRCQAKGSGDAKP
ncbi:hypothetical protein ZWY2020_007720 [Hordeum vulgare]|nr:hypothetical protein ZWY2020_007720 [Hordeum vulgare]